MQTSDKGFTMKKAKTKKELIVHKNNAINAIESYIDNLIAGNNIQKSKADKFCYWLEDYSSFLGYEDSFSPRKMRRYKRGEIIKAHLGYNIGSEEGGLHYCVVIDKNNSVNSPVLTVVPLTSVKQDTDISQLYPTQVYLGNELFTSLNAKMSAHYREAMKELASLRNIVNKLNSGETSENMQTISDVQIQIADLNKKIELITSMQDEIRRMKQGSIALVNQIRVISKIRIYDPKRNDDVLSNIKLSNEKLDAIDEVVALTYTNIDVGKRLTDCSE